MALIRRSNQLTRLTHGHAAGPGVARRILLAALLATLLGIVPAVTGCANKDPQDLETLVKETQPSGVKVLLIGIDGATFDIIKPLAADGRLPTFKRLMEQGAHGVLKSENPMFSPAIWTTIATGRPRTEHNIFEFIDRSTNTLVSSNDRRTLALWNIVSAFPLTCGISGFWATWPAEAVNGWMISDRVASDRWTEWTDRHETRNLTYPPALIDELRPLIVDPARPPWFEIERLVAFTPQELEEMRVVSKPIFGHGLSVIKYAYCAQRSYEQIALHMLKRSAQPDLMGLFLIANDPICHTFWHYWQPDKFTGVDPTESKRLGPLVPNFYVHNDAYLATLLAQVDPKTVVIIVSDHGFEASGELPQARPPDSWEVRRDAALAIGQVAVGQSGRHHIDGVLIACGGPIVAGSTVTAGVQDIAPTILAILGLPVARDLGGRVLREIIDPAFLKAHPVRTISSYEPLLKRATGEDVDLSSDPEMLKRLEALGYIGETEGTGKPTAPPNQNSN